MDKNKVWLQIDEDLNGIVRGAKINYPVLSKKTPEAYYVQSPALKAVGYSVNSFEEARQELDKDIQIFFQAHFLRQTLKTALSNLGWRKEGDFFVFEVEPYQLERIEYQEQMLMRA